MFMLNPKTAQACRQAIAVVSIIAAYLLALVHNY